MDEGVFGVSPIVVLSNDPGLSSVKKVEGSVSVTTVSTLGSQSGFHTFYGREVVRNCSDPVTTLLDP